MSLIDEHLSELPEGASQQRRLSKIGNTMLTHRLLSAQEAAFRLCHLPLKGASRTTQYVSTETKLQDKGSATSSPVAKVCRW